jgi:hypothetical protein
MIAALTKSISSIAKLKKGSVLDAPSMGMSQNTILLVLVILFLVGLYFYGRSKDKKAKGSKPLGGDATISDSQSANYANSLEGYLATGSFTTSSELNNALSLIERLSNSDLIAINNAYSKSDYSYDSLSILLNAQNMAWGYRSSTQIEKMDTVVEKLRNAGI